ncbi:hypothetical protein F6V30_03725 [Oryzomonas sagensis]|uniref:Uncharacterized protein n=1 Tax=Oryzomonas sagensis TaxID=2603857 RepID=A0ABQ6TRP1_9BACT|nr:hypothetical protein [Oryzomonas sagensis]KAB0671698.1 hypothetical protein F6V30_03725 [Oryzomonas sagensis]
MQNSVQNVFIKILDHNIRKVPIPEKTSEECLNDLYDYLKELRTKHVKKNYLQNPAYLVGWLHTKNRVLKTEAEASGFCRAHLCVAEYCFGKLLEEISKTPEGHSEERIKSFKNMIHEYLHDLRPIVEYLEKKQEPAYSFFGGGKFYGTWTLDSFRMCTNLFWTNAFEKNFVDIRAGLNLSTFSLRQSLELKFRRILGVRAITHKATGDEPKLKHDYFYKFIISETDHFKFYTPHITAIWKIYEWTNMTVHTGNIPRIWELQYAIEIVTPFFAPQPASSSGKWSIDSSVEIYDYQGLKDKFKALFHNKYTEAEWTIHFEKPEAVLQQ